MKKILLCILGFFIIILQNSIINYLSVLDELESGIIGAILGIIVDSSVGGLFGANALVFFVLAYMVSYIKDKVYKESPIMIFTIILGATFIYCVLSFLLSKTIYNVCQLTSIIKIVVVPIVNSLVGILVYKIFKKPILSLEEE